MPTISVREETLQFSLEQLTLLTKAPSSDVVRQGETLLHEQVQAGMSPLSRQLYVQNIPLRDSANSFMKSCAGGVSISNCFEHEIHPLLQGGEVLLRTVLPGMPIITELKMLDVDGEEQIADVLAMATQYSPIEYLLVMAAKRRSCELEGKEGLRIRSYKDCVTSDEKYVIPTEHAIFRYVDAYDSFTVHVNEISCMLQHMSCLPITLLAVQLLHLARGCFRFKSNSEGLSAFLNCSQWKLYLLAVYASKERQCPTCNVKESVEVDRQGTRISVTLANGVITVESTDAAEENWFRITKVLVEHLFEKEYAWPIMNETDAWMKAAEAFAFANAGCCLYDARVAIQVADCVWAKQKGHFTRDSWPEASIRQHYFFHNYELLQRVEDHDTKPIEPSRHEVKHLGTMGFEEDLLRKGGQVSRMALSEEVGVTLSKPLRSSINVDVTGFYKGKLYIQHGKFQFRQRGKRKRVDRFWRSFRGATVMNYGGPQMEFPAAIEEDANSVVEDALSCKAGLEVARWVWQHLMFASVRVGPCRPIYLAHLSEDKEGMKIVAVISKEVLVGMEVVWGEDGHIFLPAKAAEAVPDYRIKVGEQGFATLERSNERIKPLAAASIVTGVNIG